MRIKVVFYTFTGSTDPGLADGGPEQVVIEIDPNEPSREDHYQEMFPNDPGKVAELRELDKAAYRRECFQAAGDKIIRHLAKNYA